MQKRKSHFTKSVSLGLSSAIALSLLMPQVTYAGIDDLRKEQQQKQQELDGAKEREQNARAKKEQFQSEINVNAAEINKLSQEINEKENKISELQGQIFLKTQQIQKTEQELAQVEKRIAERDKLIKQRLRLMYEQGEVQYLEVLLSSTSFSDFLDRFETLQIVVKQDTEILRKNKEDREKVKATKVKLEEQKTSFVKMKTEQLDAKSKLDGLKAQKEELNQKLEANRSEQERIEAEAEALQQQAIDEIYALSRKIEEERLKQSTTPEQQFSGPFTWPVPSSYNISSEFGDRIDPFTGQRMGHNGMDIAASQGTQVVAAQSGTVITAGWVSGFGNCIIINHGGGLWSLYGHLMNGGIGVAEGQDVTKGDNIGHVGTTGRSTGPHLHFGVYLNGAVVNPRGYLGG